MMPQTVSYV